MKKKYFTVEIFIIISLAILIQLVLCLIYVLDFSQKAYKQYEDFSVMSVQNSSYKFQREINNCKKSIDELNYTTIDENRDLGVFDIILELDNGIVVNFLSKGVMPINGIKPNFYSNMIENDFDLISMKSILDSGNNDLCLIIPQKISQSNYIIYIKNLQTEIDLLIDTGFQNVIISTKDNVAVFSNDTKIINTNLLDSINFNISEYTSGDTIETYIDNKRVTLSFVDIGANFGNLNILAYMSSESVQDYVNQFSYRFMIIVISLLGISLFALILSILQFVKQYKNLTIYTGYYPDLYVIKYTKNGLLHSCNKTFKDEFGKQNVLTYLCMEGNLQQFLLNRESFPVSLKAKDGTIKFINFVVKNGVNYVKLIGGDTTKLMNEFYNYKKISETNEFTSLKNYNTLKKEYLQNNYYAMALFALQDIDIFKNMFGYSFSLKILKHYAKSIDYEFGQYGDLYSYQDKKFVLLIKNEEQYEQLIKIIGDRLDKLCEPIKLENNLIKVELDCGLYQTKGNNYSLKNLINFCETALYNAQSTEKLRYSQFLDNGKNFINYDNPDLIKEMIQKNEIDLFFQPQVDIHTGKVVGFESLCRVLNKTINIEKFINEIENKGFMNELGDFIFNKGMYFAKQIEKYKVPVSLNVSGIQFMQAGFTYYFLDKLKNNDLTKGQISIEVTESFLIGNIDETIEKLKILRGEGISIHLDDFGTAYSSLSYLKKLPIDVVKFEKAFVRDIHENNVSRAIIANIINLCKELHIKTIAEGVELEIQRKILIELGCDYVQGWLFSKAIPKESAYRYLESRNEIPQEEEKIETPKEEIVQVVEENLEGKSDENAKTKQETTYVSKEVDKQKIITIKDVNYDTMEDNEEEPIKKTKAKKKSDLFEDIKNITKQKPKN